jgi:predicted  nucleic acid-binding Zn-ribbon protein
VALMASIQDKIKAALAALHTASKTLSALDEHYGELSTVAATLDSKSEQLAELEKRLVQIGEDITSAGAEQRHWQELHSAAQAKGNEEANKLETRLKELRRQCDETQGKLDNLLAGLRALHDRTVT